MNEWFALAPTHHGALSVGHNAEQLSKVAVLMGIDFDVVSEQKQVTE